MTTFPASPSSIISASIPMGWQTGMDLSVEMSLIPQSADMKRSINGRLKNFSDPAFNLYRLKITSGSGELKAVPFTRLVPGTVFDIELATDFEDFIAPGGSVRTLVRAPKDGSVRVRDRHFQPVPFSIDGSILNLAAPATDVVFISYKPVLHCMISAPISVTESEQRNDVSWSVEAEEVGGIL